MADFLEKIRISVLERIAHMQIDAHERVEVQDFCSIFNVSPTIIAEVKLNSPSRGVIYHGQLNAVEIATGYIQHGARVIHFDRAALF